MAPPRSNGNIKPIATITPGTTPSEAGTAPINGSFILTLSDPAPAGGLTVTYTVGGTATAGSDYTPLTGSVTVAAGATSATINVAPLLDNIVDPSETIALTLTATPTSPYTLGKRKTAVLRIADQVLPNLAIPASNPFGISDIRGSAPTFADIDDDGDLDAFIGNDEGIRFFRNTGTVSSPRFIQEGNPFADLRNSSHPTFVDIDDDGDLDAFVGDSGGSTRFFRNTGTASSPRFTQEFNSIGIGFAGPVASPAFADIDGDGDLDAFIGDSNGITRFLRNIGTASQPNFAQEANNFGIPDVGSYSSPSLVDIDRDGDFDAFVGDGDGNTRFFRNTGTASLPSFVEEANNFGIPDVRSRSKPTFADIDGDGDLDAFVGDAYGSTRFFRNTGTASSPNFPAQLGSFFGIGSIISSSSPTLADIDGDGDLDAFVSTPTNSPRFFRNNGTASFPSFSEEANNFGLRDSGKLTFADIDGDGDLDAFVGDAYGNTRFFRNSGTASSPRFAREANNFGITDVGYNSAPTFADIDGDGDLDAFVGASDGTTRFFRNSGTANLPSFSQDANNFGITDVGYVSAPTFADIDGDGDLDAFVGAFDGITRFFRNNGTISLPRFALEANNFGITDVGDLSSPSFGDLDGDGDLDALVGARDGNTRFFENAPTVSVTPGSNAAEPNSPGSFTLTLSQAAPDGGITVNYSLRGTATNGSDYTAPLTATIAAGQTTATVTVRPIDDALVEGSESIILTLIDSAGYNLGSSPEASSILTDNETSPVVSIQAIDPIAIEANNDPGRFRISRTGSTTSALTVNYAIATGAGQATNGTDYTPRLTGTATIAAGASFVDFSINPVQDGLPEGRETVSLILQDTPAYDLNPAQSTARIGIADDLQNAKPIATITPDTTPSEAGTAPVNGSFILTLSDPAPAGGLTVTYTVGGTATASSDYTPLSGSVTVAAGATSAKIDVTPILDNVVDPSETIALTLTATPTSPYTLGKQKTAVLRIADQVSLSFDGSLVNPFGIGAVNFSGSPTFGDIDGDGDLDAFIGDSDGYTRFFHNRGSASTPSFIEEFDNFGISQLSRPKPVLVDIDSDGDLDIFAGDSDGRTVFFRNTGSASTPSFMEEVDNFGISNVEAFSSPAFADIDGDGDFDAFVGEGNGNTRFFRNTGSATAPSFTLEANNFGIPDVGSYSTPTFADIDEDGDFDAFVGVFDGTTRFFRNTGTTSAPRFFQEANALGISAVFYSSDPTFADIDGDGDLDAFVGDSSGSTRFFRNRGTATAPSFPSLANPPDLGGFGAAAFADIDGDGDLDAFARLGFTTRFFRNTGSATAPSFSPEANNFGIPDERYNSSLTFADIDDDGDLDAFVGAISGNTRFLRNTGTATAPSFTPEANNFGISNVGRDSRPTFADIDGDGDLDAFVGDFYGTTRFFRNTGSASTPSFTEEFDNFGIPDVGFLSTPIIADIDGDGDLDAIVAASNTSNSDPRFFRNIGTTSAPRFTEEASTFGLNDVRFFSFFALADLDGDGDLDATVNSLFFENAPTVSVTPGSDAAEPSSPGSFTLTLSQVAPDGGITVSYSLSGTATNGSDYTVPLTATIAAGQTTATVTVSPIDDTLVEGSETITLTLVDGASYNPGASPDASITIADSTSTNPITGTSGRDTLNGTAATDRITGLQGADSISTGAGRDAVAYTDIRDAGDVITDFAVGQDQIVLTQLLDSIVPGGYSGSNAIANGYVSFAAQGSNTVVLIDRDGTGSAATPRNFLTLQNVSVANANQASNFVF